MSEPISENSKEKANPLLTEVRKKQKIKIIPDYPQASATFKRRWGIGGVRTAA